MAKRIRTIPAHLHFQERGRYDAQLTKKAHCVVGPSGFEFRSRMVVTHGNDTVGDRVYVCWGVLPSGAYVRCLATEDAIGATADSVAAGDWSCGVITRKHGTNDLSILFQPSVK